MKYTVRKSFVDVVGRIWMPSCVCSMRYPIDGYALENMRDDDGKITRETVEAWLTSHAGDFQHIIDFSASIEDEDTSLAFPFATEDGEVAYLDTISEED